MTPLEMWAGLECTLNRVGDRFINQIEKNGHLQRLSDLRLFAGLKVSKIRYPCLWEMVAPDQPNHFNWDYLDERLGELRRLGITPIAGFVHHGSGPRYTGLMDPEFPEKLAFYARAFAERYPWIEYYTPVNEILTTARFSCLYGHWFPHLKDHAAFLRAIFNQVKGTVLAMKAIREIIPQALLIQTDDLGRAQGTEPLKYQIDYENERRWLGWDLLCGKIDNGVLKENIVALDIQEKDLQWFVDNPCPPDVIGINHYLLSNRFLDHRLDLYPQWSHGGNGIDKYADVGAVDTGEGKVPDPLDLLMEVWDRYRLPLAVTEVHTMGSRDSQMRWLYEMWNAAGKARELGADVRAITAWSLLGTFDWHKLCTTCEMFYEPGVYDLRSPNGDPRETGLSRLVTELATRGNSDHPVLEQPGWWKNGRRILWAAGAGSTTSLSETDKNRTILIAGATGTLGQAFARICGKRNIPYRLVARSFMDISDLESVQKAINEIRPWAIINAAGYVKVDEAEVEKDQCFTTNVKGAVNLAMAAQERKIPFLTFSTDLVFDGNNCGQYFESHQVSPLNVYGHSKAESESQVLNVNEKSLIVRTSSFFGPWDEFNFVINTLRLLSGKKEVLAARDITMSPTYIPDLVNACLDLLLDSETGIVHLTNKGIVSWEDFARISAGVASTKMNLDPTLIIGMKLDEMNLKARRPKNSALGSERYAMLPPLEEALARYFEQLDVKL